MVVTVAYVKRIRRWRHSCHYFGSSSANYWYFYRWIFWQNVYTTIRYYWRVLKMSLKLSQLSGISRIRDERTKKKKKLIHNIGMPKSETLIQWIWIWFKIQCSIDSKYKKNNFFFSKMSAFTIIFRYFFMIKYKLADYTKANRKENQNSLFNASKLVFEFNNPYQNLDYFLF